MYFLLELRERKRAEALAKQAKADADAAEARAKQAKAYADAADAAKARAAAAETARVAAAENTRKFLANLTDAQKDAIYTGPVAIGDIILIKIHGKYAFGPRDSTDWLVDAFAPPRADNRCPQCCCTP